MPKGVYKRVGRAHNFIDLAGQQFSRLLVLKYVYTKNRYAYWRCLCGCGNETVVAGANLRSDNVKSCGCLRADTLSEIAARPCSEEHRKNLSEALKGNSVWNKGLTAETDDRIYSGEEHPRYNLNLTNKEREKGRKISGYKEWHAAVFERDNFTCQCCGKHGGNLVTHHKNGYNNFPELRTLLENGVTLCEKYHDDFHHQYGYGNNTRKQFKKFRKENR